MKKISFLVLICNMLFAGFLYAQKFEGPNASKIVAGCETVWVNPDKGNIIFVKLKASENVPENENLTWIRRALSLPKSCDLILKRKETDRSGFTHYRYQFSYNQIPFENAFYFVHTRNGRVLTANGDYPDVEPAKVKAAINQAGAYDIAYQEFSEKSLYPEIQEKPVLTYIKAEKAIFLAYKFDFMSSSSPRREYIYVNALSGEIIKVTDRICTSDASGTAETKYNGIQPITSDFFSSQYRLRESSRGGGVETYDCNTGTSYYSAVDFTNATNYWNTTTNQDDAAYDAHYSAEAVYDYYLNIFGRNSFDNANGKIMCYTHYDYNYANAFWNGSFMTFGDGNGYEYTALTSLDVVAHEFTHGVTQYTADLIYSGESGALNESFSDIFGICVDYYKHPLEANFQMGEQISLTSTPIRDIQTPNNSGNPDTYQGTYWDPYEEVHKNSTVQSYWFYLLTNGGSGINDIGNSYTVSGIGIEAAAAIAYRNLSVYLVPSSDYAQAREFSIQSAMDLYGPCSPELIACTNAWYAVGVGAQFSSLVVADFTASNIYSCSVPATINFTNNSLNSSEYHWNFGDGGSSSIQNPSHVYSTAGNYTVSLIVSGSASCGGTSDTLIQPGYITITNTGGPIPASCTPGTQSSYGSNGITHFVLNTIDNTSAGASAGYEDFTCSNSTSLKEAKQYSLSATLGSNYYNHVKIWLDNNNDGQFAVSEILADSLFNSYTLTKSIRIPHPVTNNLPLRLRIGSDEGSYSLNTACTNSYYGQYEDYSLIVMPNTDSPVADFAANFTTIPIGTTVSFADKSENVVTSWQWTFVGGSSLHSAVQNPSITYNVLGIYPVKLKVANAYGQDSISKTAYIQVVNSFNLCSGTDKTVLASGNLYDSGGPSDNYANSENCTFLIDNCATSITLSFSQFSTEGCCDYIRVYDGESESGTLLLSAAGTTLPQTVIAYSGKMFIKFTSDGSVTSSGFAAAWNSIIPSGNPPAGDFSISSTNPPLNTPVIFTDNSSDDATSWNWNFGDGNTSTEQNPSHNFLSPGTYAVEMIVHNCFNADTVIKSLIVQAAPSITITPSSFNISLEACGSGTSREINISNLSGGTLSYKLSANSANTNPGILMILNGVDTYSEGAHTIDAINQYFTDYTLTQATLSNAAELSTLLIGKNIVLIPEVENYPGSIYGDIGNTLQTFVNNGGSVIFCGSSSYGSIIFDTGLLSGNVIGTTSSSNIVLTSVVHPITQGLPTSFYCSNSTAYYSITSPNAVALAETGYYDAILYRTLGQGKIVLLGYDYYEFDNNAAKIIANAVKWCAGSNGPPWLEVSPSEGNITAGKNQLVNVAFNSDGLPGGTYTYNLLVNSNDPSHLVTTIPITLNVSNKPCANFGYRDDICSGMVVFTDSSFNNPTSWNWNFGDGFTSTLQNPLHSYSTAGNHLVSLIVCNSTNCDTGYRQVSLASVGGPVEALCNPAGSSYMAGMGIYNVKFNTIQNATTEDYTGYQDYSCSQHTVVNPGIMYTLEIQTSYQNTETVAVWIDYNNNGEFGTSELVAGGNTSSSIFTGYITIPITAVQNRPLRMRIGSDYSGYGSLTPCSGYSYGQFEDYSVIIQPVNVPPTADFAYSFIDNCQGIVQFTNQTLNNATSFEWVFGDGGISYQENPIHIYSTAGTFAVVLKATNDFGHTQIEKSIVTSPVTANITTDGSLEINKNVTFNTNATATSYDWDFGDGQVSALKSPTHNYPVAGTYIVQLTVISGLCTYTTSMSIFVRDPNGIDESAAGSGLNIYPNPGNGIFFLKLENNKNAEYKLEVYNTLGAIILQDVLYKSDKVLIHQLDLSAYPSGTYTVIFRNADNKPIHAKLIKL